MFKILTSLFDENKKALGRYQKVVDQINQLESHTQSLTDKQLVAKTAEFKTIIESNRLQNITDSQTLKQLLPEAFAVVRETSRRVIGLRHFDVQLMAGIALHEGSITEQRTGEGKTLTVTAPIYLNALLGKGVHLVTVNDYLAEIGAGWMAPIYHFLGLSTANIGHDKSGLYDPDFTGPDRGDERLEHFRPITRQAAYAADITYGTNNEFGFDYLRDNMVQSLEQMAQRPDNGHHFAIVDEADSILIDEARTPLIISAPDTEPTKQYYDYAKMVTSLGKDTDYTLDEKARSVTLTDLGVKRLEQKLGVSNLYEEKFDTIHHVESALKALTLFHRDKEYIVRENQVIIVDEHTGRLMYGRRYSDGLHQAIEAKENVPIQQESRTLATVSLQNYFRLYKKLSGMTGTAATEAEEFRKIYNVDVVAVPTNVPTVRQDKADIVYKTTAAKYSAITKEVERIHDLGQPILIGTRSISHNQIIADFLTRKKIPHQLLNAKNHEKEAFIIADAGKKGAITVATNIAGRGVDIVLGGAKPELKDYRLKSSKDESVPKPTKTDLNLAAELKIPPAINPAQYDLINYQHALQQWQKDHDEVVATGGLCILGTERHESRRIDNQLRGRAGRQGDPGTSQFFIALDDDIMRIFGGTQIAKVMDMLKFDEGQPIEHGMISKSIESAQVKVEGFFFDQRKRLVEFDDVMNKQREIIYARRRRLLELGSELTPIQSEQDQATSTSLALDTADSATSLRDLILGYVKSEVTSIVNFNLPKEFVDSEYRTLAKEFAKIIPFDDMSQQALAKELQKFTQAEELIEHLQSVAEKAYTQREKGIGIDAVHQLEKVVTLSTIDEKWMDHLDAMETLREGIWLRGDKQTVLSEYKKEAFSMFEQLLASVESTIANRIFRVQLLDAAQIQQRQPTQVIAKKADINEELTKEVRDASLPAAPAGTQGSTSDLAAALSSAKAIAKPQPGSSIAKIGRNDPCPCGSGLKFKKCGLIGAPQHQG